MTEILLDEDKVVKFDNQTYPKFGWCVILAGGAGSGKGYSYEHYIPIQGKVYDPDEIKRLNLLTWRVEEHDETDDLLILADGTKVSLDKEGVRPPYNTTNPKFTQLVHKLVKPQTKRFKNWLMSQERVKTNKELPNIIFDNTLSEIGDYEALIDPMKSLGYKVAIVYVFTGIDTAVANNEKRKGKVPKYNNVFHKLEYGRDPGYDILLATHRGMFNAFAEFRNRPDLISKLDGVWVIMAEFTDRVKVFDIKNGDKIDINDKRIEEFIKQNISKINKRTYDYEQSLIEQKFGHLYDADLYDLE